MNHPEKTPRLFLNCKRETVIGKSWLLAICIALGGCSYADGFLVRDNGSENAAIARSVKAGLMNSELIEAAPIRVSATTSTIVLEGFVESPEQKNESERIAEELHPEYEIVNKIRVR